MDRANQHEPGPSYRQPAHTLLAASKRRKPGMPVFFDEKPYMLDEKRLGNALRHQLESLVPKTLKSAQEKAKWMDNVMNTPQVKGMLKTSITQIIQTVMFYVGHGSRCEKEDGCRDRCRSRNDQKALSRGVYEEALC
jgi:hypothetical protein